MAKNIAASSDKQYSSDIRHSFGTLMSESKNENTVIIKIDAFIAYLLLMRSFSGILTSAATTSIIASKVKFF